VVEGQETLETIIFYAIYGLEDEMPRQRWRLLQAFLARHLSGLEGAGGGTLLTTRSYNRSPYQEKLLVKDSNMKTLPQRLIGLHCSKIKISTYRGIQLFSGEVPSSSPSVFS
jgi:hypothetical protein